jgi:hypothetical protein
MLLAAAHLKMMMMMTAMPCKGEEGLMIVVVHRVASYQGE